MSEGPAGGQDSRRTKEPPARQEQDEGGRRDERDEGGQRDQWGQQDEHGQRDQRDKHGQQDQADEQLPRGESPAGDERNDQKSAAGDTYDLYRRGLDLLGRGSAAAAAQLLERAAAAEPQSRSVLEALARAQFDAGHYAAAAGNFRRIVEASPSDDYAQFGLGLALARTGDPGAAAEHLALAAAMQPDRRHYTDALRSVRATLRARAEGQGSASEGPQRKARGV